MNILGIHDGHNAAACLLSDGKICAALQEERITRVKNDFTFPKNAINKILEIANLSPKDIDKIVFASNHLPYSTTKEEMLKKYKESENNLKVLIKNSLRKTFVFDNYLKTRQTKRIESAKSMGFKEANISFIEHHLCHASAAYWGSEFDKNDKVLILTADGAGDGLCATVTIAEKGTLNRIAEVKWSHSIGSIYAKITYLLGMVPNEHEYKIMGMSPYGDIEGSKKIYNKLQSWFQFEENGLTWRRAKQMPHTYYSYEFLKKDF